MIRGPGREKYEAASTATTSPAPSAASWSRCISASRWAISASKPHGITITIVRLGRGDQLPGLLLRVLAAEAEHVLAARVVDQLRRPMAGREGRIEPFERDHARSPCGPHGQADAVDPLGGLANQLDSRILGVCGLCDRSGIAENLSNRVRVERDHHRLAVELLGDLLDVVDGDRAHLAERLRDDQVGLQLVQELSVELVDRFARQRALLDRGIDLRRREPRRQLVARDPWQLCCRRRVVALMSDGDDVVAEAEREEHLGRRRDQAYDAHMRSTI